MGYEMVLVIPVIIFISATVIHYQKKLWKKSITITLTVLICFFYMFIHPGIFGIKKRFPYIYWTGGRETKIRKIFDGGIKGMLEKIGFTFVED